MNTDLIKSEFQNLMLKTIDNRFKESLLNLIWKMELN